MAEQTSGTSSTTSSSSSSTAAKGTAPSGSATTTTPETVESAKPGETMPDALGNMPEETSLSATQTDAEELQRVAAEGRGTSVGGLALPTTGEIAGGNIEKYLAPPPESLSSQRPMVKEQAALTSPIGKQIAGMIARPVTEWGVLGPGDRVKGSMILLDLNSGEKARAADGHIINKGELYMNLRNAPEALSTGDTIEKVLG